MGGTPPTRATEITSWAAYRPCHRRSVHPAIGVVIVRARSYVVIRCASAHRIAATQRKVCQGTPYGTRARRRPLIGLTLSCPRTMAPIVENIIAVLERQPDAGAAHDAFLNAAFLFEKSRGVLPCAWPDEVAQSNASPEDMRRLRDAVAKYVERNGVGSSTLGKCFDASLKPVLVSVLQRQLQGDAGELFQAMIALDNLHEPVFGDVSSRSILDEQKNRDLARRYLEAVQGGHAGAG